MILPHRLGYPIMSNWRSIVTVTPLLPNSAHKRSASCFSFAAALPICDAPRRIMCMLGGGNSMIRDRQPTVCVTRWEWKCWRGCVYPKASSAHSPGKSTNGSIPIPLGTTREGGMGWIVGQQKRFAKMLGELNTVTH